MAETTKDILLNQKSDRRMLPNVPDEEQRRSNIDRRGIQSAERKEIQRLIDENEKGRRYEVEYPVQASCEKQPFIHGVAKDISTTGILLEIREEKDAMAMKESDWVKLKFEILPGTMPEGYEMKVSLQAKVMRVQKEESSGIWLVGLQFKKPLAEYANEKRGRYMLCFSSILLLGISFFIVLMRAESIIYFKFNRILYLYSILTAIFLLSRYLFSAFYKPVPVDMDYTPGVTILIPCFNEEEWIQRTILSCMNQDYPMDKLDVIVIDDCSSDRSVEKIDEIIEQLKKEGQIYRVEERLSRIVQETNQGKREAICAGAEAAKQELLVFVDSDSFLDPYAIRNLVQPFKDPKVGGAAGRTDVANTYTNALTKMQAVRYYISFRVMKAAEAVFDTVSCLSGPLSCYRRNIVLAHENEWLNQRFLGQKATFGDDRAMTNFILRTSRTTYQDTAVCSTIVPNQYSVFLKQQMRWKRSWLRESILAGSFMWKKEPFASITFYMGLLVPLLAPIVVCYNLIYIPIAHRVIPTTFLLGLFMMAALMSAAQMFLKKSTTWAFGFMFCFFYEAVLLWQMPIAWFTFWKSTWGTRMTPKDLLEQARRAGKRKKKEEQTS